MREGRRPGAAGAERGGAHVQFVLPADPERMRIGGIASFVRGFAKFAPADFELSLLGMTASLPLWQWTSAELEGRQIRFLPVVRERSERRAAIPLAARFTAALWRHRGRLGSEARIRSFHRPATDLPLARLPGPMWRVVHLSVADLTARGSESRWRRSASVLAAVERRSFRRMDRIYVVNRTLGELYRDQFPEVAERIRFLSNWADHTIFRPVDAGRRQELRAELWAAHAIGELATIVLYAGRLEGQKDPLLLARSFAEFRRRAPGAVLLIAGSGTMEELVAGELERLGAAGATRFLGTVPREELANLMNATDALLITSAFETGPTVGLEALACGLPVVTTRVGEVARVVEASGAGWLASGRDPGELAAGLEWVVRHPVGALRDLCAEAARPFLADRVLSELYDYNRELAAGLGSHPGMALANDSRAGGTAQG